MKCVFLKTLKKWTIFLREKIKGSVPSGFLSFLLKKGGYYEFKITGDDMIYVYDKDELVSIITAGYDDEIGYFIAISFLDS